MLNVCDSKKHQEKIYTLKEKCPKCGTQTKSPEYKFKNVRDAPKTFKKILRQKINKNCTIP